MVFFIYICMKFRQVLDLVMDGQFILRVTSFIDIRSNYGLYQN